MMKTKILHTMCIIGATVMINAAALAQKNGLDGILKRLVTERLQLPAVFSTRDSLFALSLPDTTEGPAEVYLQLTVTRNGRVKEKKTRVSANHVGVYVAPTFVAAAKGVRIDPDDMPRLEGRDTALLLTFPLEYRCVLDTMTKAWPNAGDRLRKDLYSSYSYFPGDHPLNPKELEKSMQHSAYITVTIAQSDYIKAIPTRQWYYLVFLANRE